MNTINLLHDRAINQNPVATSPQLLTLPSRFDVHQVQMFDNIVNNMFESGTSFVLIDAQDVMHVDQVGINTILEAADRAAVAGVRFRVVSSTTLRVALELVLEVPDASILFGNELLGQAA